MSNWFSQSDSRTGVTETKTEGDIEHRTVTLTLGSYQDIVSSKGYRGMRIHLEDIPDPGHALLNVHAGLAFIYHGDKVSRAGQNTFLVPQGELDTPDEAVFHYMVSDVMFSFWRVVVDHINPHAKEVVVLISFVELMKTPGLTNS